MEKLKKIGKRIARLCIYCKSMISFLEKIKFLEISMNFDYIMYLQICKVNCFFGMNWKIILKNELLDYIFIAKV